MKKQICDVKYSLEDVIKNGSGFGEEAEDFATKSILEAEDERILKEVLETIKKQKQKPSAEN